jgi:hypothetical protein
MVDIVCSPPKQLVILECTRYPSLDALAKVVAVVISAGESIILKWADGVAFMYTFLQPTTDELVSELLKGRVFWSEVYYAEMPEYKQSIRVGTLDVPVLDMSPNPLLKEAARWLKKQH